MSELTTKHIQNNDWLYFFPKEKGALIFAGIFFFLLGLVLVTFQAYIELAVLFCVFMVPIFLLGILPAYKRAKFLSEGNYYRVLDGVLENQVGGMTERFSYKGKNVKYIQRRDSIIDIVIGENVEDFFKFFGSTERTKITICGVTNGDEILKYLRLHG